MLAARSAVRGARTVAALRPQWLLCGPRLERMERRRRGASFADLGRDEKLALLINAYNAFTLRLILDHYPIKSIKDIPSAKRWDAKRWRLDQHRLLEEYRRLIYGLVPQPNVKVQLSPYNLCY